MTEPWVFDVESRSATRLALDPILTDYFAPVMARDAW
jgi:hypothetical protein